MGSFKVRIAVELLSARRNSSVLFIFNRSELRRQEITVLRLGPLNLRLSGVKLRLGPFFRGLVIFCGLLGSICGLVIFFAA
jgi:hypothetical protein